MPKNNEGLINVIQKELKMNLKFNDIHKINKCLYVCSESFI